MEDLKISLITFKVKEISFHFSKIDCVINISSKWWTTKHFVVDAMLSARNFGLILALCAIIRVLPDLTFEYKDIICPYSHVKCRFEFKASDAFFLEKHVVNAPFIRRSRASRYFDGRVQYSANGVSTFQIQRDLLVCGDISSSPGPAKGKGKPKFPCGECSKPVRNSEPRRHLVLFL